MKHLLTKLKGAACAALAMGLVLGVRADAETYCVIDLTTSPNYTVTYQNDAPTGGWNQDEYKMTKIVLRYIAAGTVITNADNQSGITISSPYYTGIFPVTELQYAIVMNEAPGSESDYKKPKTGVKWSDFNGANGFVETLKAKAEINLNLPTHEQWEYACRAGTSTTYYYGDTADQSYMWISENASGTLQSVGTASAEVTNGGNPWGLYDMHGNVYEWTLTSNVATGWDFANQKEYQFFGYVACGGAFAGPSEIATSSSFETFAESSESPIIGFRLVYNLSSNPEPTESEDFITFTSTGPFAISVSIRGWDEKLYWTTNKSLPRDAWAEWQADSNLEAKQIDGTGDYHIYIYGTKGNTRICTDNGGTKWQLVPTGENKIACSGNIETLRGATGNQPSSTEMAEYCYTRMFIECTALTSAPDLPATNLANSCYAEMFLQCTSLTNAPVLPSTILSEFCYLSMFSQCTALKHAPALPAMTLSTCCYDAMFSGCTALENAPILPAMTLAYACYVSMFYGCTALGNAPTLPATTLADNCYGAMFFGCTALTNAPALPATTLKEACYQNMFYGCTALTYVPVLPAKILAEGCYSGMFAMCSALVINENAPGAKWSIPAGAVDPGSSWAWNMFSGTGGTFTGAPEVGKTYYVESDWKREVDLGGGMTARDYYDGDWAIVGNGEVAAAQTAVLKDEPVTNLWIHTGVTGVGASAFTDSAFWTLRDVTLGASCTNVGERAFKKCYGLTNVTSKATGESSVGNYAFSGCHSLQGLSFAGTASFEEKAYTLQAAIYMKDSGIPVVYAMPTITVAGKSEHIMGKKTLADEWTDVTNFTDDEKKEYHFFKIEIK